MPPTIRLTLEHSKDAAPSGTTTVASYDYTYDVGNRITSLATTSIVAGSNTSTYSYDLTDQVTGATHTSTSLPNETFAWDENGNPSASTIGTWNRLLSDGTFDYTYDANGNRISRTRISTAPSDDYETIYTWDHRNQLTSITEKNNSGTVTRQIDYAYNAFRERIEKEIDLDGAGLGASSIERYVYDGTDILVVVEDSGAVQQRMLHGPAVDQILAIEDDSTGDVSWSLPDHLGSVRDVVDQAANVLNRIDYDTFGGIADESDASVDFHYGYTARDRDEESGLNYHRARYFDPATDRWMSQDPIRFAAGDSNLYRYVSNTPSSKTDPSGLEEDLPWYNLYSIGRRVAGLFGVSIENDIEGNSNRLDNIEHLGPGQLTAGGNFHVSPGTVATIQGMASYPIIVATIVTPGPEDVVAIGISKWLGSRGLQVVREGGEWLVKETRSKKIVAEGDDAIEAYIRNNYKGPTEVADRKNLPVEAQDVLDGFQQGIFPPKSKKFDNRGTQPLPGEGPFFEHQVKDPDNVVRHRRIIHDEGSEIYYYTDNIHTGPGGRDARFKIIENPRR